MTKAPTDTTPLGIIDSLSAGFGTVAQKPALLILPLLLDLFLWFGPRLSVAPLIPELTVRLETMAQEIGDSSAELFAHNMGEILNSYNMFSALSTWPLGIPSLLAGNAVSTAPVGTPRPIHLHSLAAFLVWLILLTVAGLLAGSLYLGIIARHTSARHTTPGRSPHLWRPCFRILGLVAVVLMGVFAVSVPFFLTVELVATIAAPLAPLLLVIGAGAGMWGLFHLFFAAHAILVDNLSLSHAMAVSVALIHRHRLSSAVLLLTAALISLGLGTIWNIPPSGSWMRLVAIAGNAFVNTGLATATFVFYLGRTSR